MPNYKMLLDINLNGMPRVEDKLLHVSRNKAFKSKITQANFYESSLKKYRNGESLNEKINKLINLVNTKGHNIEVIQKSSKGQDFRNFIRAEQKNTNRADISNVAFIIRVGNIEESLVPANTVILTVAFERTFKVISGIKHPHFNEILKSIQLTKLPEERYGHRAVISLDKIDIQTHFEPEETQLKERDFGKLSGLAKAFDMYNAKETKIQLKEQSHFIQKFFYFLNAKEDNKLTPYLISNEDSMKLEEENDYSFYTIFRDVQKIEAKDRFYIGSNKDYSSKIGAVVRKVEVLSYEDLIEEQIDQEENHITRLEEMILESKEGIIKESNNLSVLSQKQNELSSRIKVSKDSLKNSTLEVNSSRNRLKHLEEEYKSLVFNKSGISEVEKNGKKDLKKKTEVIIKAEKNILKSENAIKELSKKELKVKKLKKGEKPDPKERERSLIQKKEKVTSLKVKIEGYLETIEVSNSELLIINKSLVEISDQLRGYEKAIEEQSETITSEKEVLDSLVEVQNKNKEELSKEEKYLKELSGKHSETKIRIDALNTDIEKNIDTISEVENGIQIINDNLETFMEDDLVFAKIKVSITSSKREKSLQKSLNIETSTFKDIAYRLPKDSYFSDYDAGLNQKFKRFFHTIRAYESGSYKSPYAALSLEKPDVSINVEEQVKSQSIGLNKFQQQALNATANSHFASFLQGPPGTGKTQVIASAVENEVANGGNVLISSSTNAAINNAMERMNRSKTNPNIFFLRHSNNIDKIKDAQDFTSQKLYPNFINRLDGFVSKNSLNEEIDMRPFEASIGEKFTKAYAPGFYFDEFISQINNIKDMEYFIERFDIVEEEDLAMAKSEAQEQMVTNRRSSMKAKAEAMDALINTTINRVPFEREDTFDSYLEKLRNYSSSDKSGGDFNRKLKNLTKRFEANGVDESKSKDFANYLFKNSYINVIGITTTSQLAIKETGGNTQRELFVDYPINFAIIDEISKSVTPEILSVAKLADRFMFAGDYRQLPPTSEISPKLIEEFRVYCIENFVSGSMADKTVASFGLNDPERFKNSIEDLLGISLFTNQVNDMKRSKKENTSYTALKTQYRFSSVINELVNLTYDTKEALEPGKKDSEFEKYEMGIKNLSNSSVTIVDTSYISKDYADKLNKKKVTKIDIEEGQESFDHNDSIFARRAPYNSKVNEYNVHVVIEIIKNLQDRNKKTFDTEKIGVIAMTRSQSQIIKKELGNLDDKSLKNIKVDTVDNFQGQEKDIIILDLVRAKGQLSGNKIIYKGRNLDFYKKPERINVAVSRAKSKLIVVGAINDYLSQEVVSEVQINGSVESINLFEEWKDIVDAKGENTSWINY